jgi:hypothetical protein
MIEPYRTVIVNKAEKFALLGFHVISDSEYQMSMAREGYKLSILTERYYHPSLSMALIDPSGVEFELGLLKKIIDPVRFDEDSRALKNLAESYKHASLMGEREKISEYVALCIDQVLAFLLSWRHIVFSDLSQYKKEYDARERLLLRDLGI